MHLMPHIYSTVYPNVFKEMLSFAERLIRLFICKVVDVDYHRLLFNCKTSERERERERKRIIIINILECKI